MFLKNYQGAIITVSHDQYFLDHLANQIFELNFGKLTTFKGNYSQYVKERELMDSQQEAAYEKQQEKIKKKKSSFKRTWFVLQLLNAPKAGVKFWTRWSVSSYLGTSKKFVLTSLVNVLLVRKC